ncbi:MAG: NAD(P)-dependent alcohol dehydrogenase [Opitutales bacterium]
MKAWEVRQYRTAEGLVLTERPDPQPRAGEVLIRIRATTVTAGDWRVRMLDVPTGFGLLVRLMFGWSKPRQPVMGSELAGDVLAVGEGVTAFAPGDPVAALSDQTFGCHAEQICLPATAPIVRKPDNLDYGTAAALGFGGTTALHFFRKGNLGRGDRVLVNGASGAVGSAAVQLAGIAGARVTAVCGPDNVEAVRGLGADAVIDYTQTPVAELPGPFEVVMDTVGTLPPARARRLLVPGGRLLQVYGNLPGMLKAPFINLRGRMRVVVGVAIGTRADLQQLADHAAAGPFRPWVGRTFPFAALPDAYAWVGTGHKRGNAVVLLDKPETASEG